MSVATATPPQAIPELQPIVEYLPFVRRVAQRIARRLPAHVRLEDLVGAGVVGLLEAMERFEPDSEKARDFQTFAEFRVKGAILDELRRRDVMARDARIEAKKVEKSVNKLAQLLGREPEDEEVAQHLGIPLDQFHDKMERLTPVRVLSMGDLYGSDQPSSGDSPFDIVAQNELKARLIEAISELNQRHQQILRLYYQEGLTLRQIGEVFGITESRSCQLLSAATLRLRALLGVEAPAKQKRRARRRGTHE